ncbi:hypothetical protein QTP86_015810, partial [Hemibagrus guttatus]
MLFIDYSSAFNTVILHKLTHKLFALGLHPTLCDWLLDFLTGRPQCVRIGNRTSATIIKKNWHTTGVCSQSHPLHTVHIILKFADDTAVIGRITGRDEVAYRREVASLVIWCEDNHITLNTDKTKEMIVDMGKERRPLQPLIILSLSSERAVEKYSWVVLSVQVRSSLMWTTRYLKLLTLSTSSFWTLNTTQLYFLRRLRKFGKSLKILNNFYDCVIESILTNCIIVWYGSTTVRDRKHLQRVVKTAEIIRIPLPSLQTIYQHRKAASTPPIPNMDCSNSYPQDSYSDHIS